MRSRPTARTLAEAHRRRRRRLRPLGQGRVHAPTWSARWRANPIIFAMANPDPEITPEEVARDPRRRHHGDRPLGLSRTRSTTSSASPTSSAARSTCAPRTINMEMKIAAAAGAGRARPRGRAGRGRRRLSGRAAALRARLHHPGAVRSAPDPRRSRRRSRRRRWIPASRAGRSSTCAPTRRSSRPAAIRSPARCKRIFERVRRYPEARRLRRGRGGAGDPRRGLLRQPGPRHGHPGRPRGPHARDRRGRRHRSRRPRRASRSTTRACRTATATYAQFLYERLQRKGYPVPRLPAPDQPGPQPFRRLAWWRSATPTRW